MLGRWHDPGAAGYGGTEYAIESALESCAWFGADEYRTVAPPADRR